jgi:predicted DNA binding CopG/RHH family protein
MKIDADEKELLESVERGEWKSAGGGKRERTRYTRNAKATFRKDRRLNIRLSSKDLEAIQKRALCLGRRARLRGRPRQTEVEQLHPVRGKEDVRRFQIAMHHAAAMQRLSAARTASVIWTPSAHGNGPAGQLDGKRLSLEQFHGQEQLSEATLQRRWRPCSIIPDRKSAGDARMITGFGRSFRRNSGVS